MLKRNILIVAVIFGFSFLGFSNYDNHSSEDPQAPNIVVEVIGPNCENAVVKVQLASGGGLILLSSLGGCTYGASVDPGKYDVIVCYDNNYGFGNTTVKENDNQPFAVETNPGGCNWQ